MTDTPQAPEPQLLPARPGLLSRISVVWLVPVLALVVSLFVAWQSYSQRGVLIEIAFENATGVAAGKTEVRYRDVSVGLVEEIAFSEDLSNVLVRARIDRDVAPYLDGEARFWVVRPQVSVRGVSGLDTVLSGVFIEGSWDGEIGTYQTQFTGDDSAPLVRPGRAGTLVVLRSRDGNQLAAGAPILHKGVRVGSIEAPRLTPSGNSVVVTGFIEAPYDALLNTATRFWDTSGFDISLGASGVRLDVQSLASLVEGGINFANLVAGGAPLTPGLEFPIYESEDAARESLFEEGLGQALMLTTVFEGSVGGLAAGSDVRFRGLRVGEVTAVEMVAGREGNRRSVHARVEMALRPGGFGLGAEADTAELLTLLSDYVARGLRARLSSGTMLGGSLVVELAELPEAGAAEIDRSARPYPRLPSAEASLADFAATAEGVFNRINALPVEDLIASAIGVLDNLNALVASDDARQIVPELTATLEEARGIAEQFRTADSPAKLNAALEEISGLMAEIRAAGTAEQFAAALSAAEASFIRLNALELDALVASADAILDAAAEVVGAEGAETVLPELAATLEEVRQVAEQLRAADSPAKLNAALEETRLLAAEFREAGTAAQVSAALAAAEASFARFDALELETLVASADEVLSGAAAVVGAEGSDALLPELTATLEESRAVLAQIRAAETAAKLSGTLEETQLAIAELRAADAGAKLSSTLASAEAAAAAVAEAAEELPAISRRLDQLAQRAETVLSAYGREGRLLANANDTLRDISEAADALKTLARTLQRNPNSIILGR